MRIGIAADHGGFELKVQLTSALKAAGYEIGGFRMILNIKRRGGDHGRY